MRKQGVAILAVALVVMAMAPSMAFGALTNEYGMTFAGTATCIQAGCHDVSRDATVHGRFVKSGLVPGAPAGWTVFKAAGDPTPIPGATAPAMFDQGGSYAIAQPWLTFGDYAGGAPTEYAFWHASANANILPWNLVEGLVAEPTGEWLVGSEAPAKGLYDVQYGCQRCHNLGATIPKPNPSSTATVPNPAATTAVTATTARQWARDTTKTVNDFMTDPTVSYPGMSIGCERCHGTGVPAGAGVAHMITGVKVNTSLATLGQSQVCGQCHGSYVDVAGTLGIYGYTPNLPMRDFVNINGLDKSGFSYTRIPTEAEFMDPGVSPSPKASAASYYMFPNGSNAKGNHYYYDEWAASAHSYRGALTAASADAMPFQAAGNGHYATSQDPTLSSGCYKCHTGEGYLKTKGADIAADFTPAPDNVGFMGQECVTCHNPHPSAVGSEDTIRTPDVAGERSATGLSVDNASICEDCHNWQYEVTGTTPAPKPQATLSARGGASHPQRETVHGRVMVEVAQAGEFMPGAKCEDCHMPKTNKSANRFSHGMKPMLPGKADEWMTAAGAAYVGEDSCSNCHAGQTRDELQASIDTWQTDTQAAADAAAAAITAVTDAATPPAEYSLTDSSKAGYLLIGKATWNYKAYVNDLSGGVHNPEYVIEGLVKAKEMADSVGGSFANLLATTSILPGSTGSVSGKVLKGDGTAAAGVSLKLFAGGVATGDTTEADAGGHFAFLKAPSVGTDYSVVWVRSSDPLTDLTSSTVTMAVARQPFKMTIALSKTRVAVNRTVKISGSVMTNVGGIAAGSVAIERKPASGGAWKPFKTLTLDAGGLYTVTAKMTKRGSWLFRAKTAEDTTHPITYSASKRLRVY